MADEYLNINPQPSPPGKEPLPENDPLTENKPSGWLKSLLSFLVLVAVVVASFWISFQLGRKILMPVRKTPAEKIEVAIPEPPPSIKAMQKLQEAMSREAGKKEKKIAPKKEMNVAAAPVRSHREAASKPACKIKPKKVAASGKGYFKVQAGFFKDKAKADALAAKMKAGGFETFLRKVNAGWRVQAGAYKTKPIAEVLRQKLKAKGFDSSIIYE